MNGLRILFAMTIMTVAAFAEQLALPPDDIYGTPPPSTVNQWARLSILGDRHHPFLIVWISPQRFARSGFEYFENPSPAQYERFLALVRANRCLPLRSEPSGGHTLLITEHSTGKPDQFCVLPLDAKCDFASKAQALPGFTAMAGKYNLIHLFAGDMECGF